MCPPRRELARRRALRVTLAPAMELACDRTGVGPPLVLIHGIGSRRGVWDPVVPLLAAEREVLAVDLPGFGASPPLPAGRAPDVRALADALVEWWRRLGLERPHVAGNSLGGGIALELARMGAVASAAALSPIGFWTRAELAWAATMLRVSRALAAHAGEPLRRAARSRAGRIATLGHIYGRPGRRDPDAAALDIAALAAAPGWRATLRAARHWRLGGGGALADTPVTVAWGTRDRLLIPRQARRAQAALPRARHVPLPGCGHVPMSDDPQGVAALLLAASADER